MTRGKILFLLAAAVLTLLSCRTGADVSATPVYRQPSPPADPSMAMAFFTGCFLFVVVIVGDIYVAMWVSAKFGEVQEPLMNVFMGVIYCMLGAYGILTSGALEPHEITPARGVFNEFIVSILLAGIFEVGWGFFIHNLKAHTIPRRKNITKKSGNGSGWIAMGVALAFGAFLWLLNVISSGGQILPNVTGTTLLPGGSLLVSAVGVLVGDGILLLAVVNLVKRVYRHRYLLCIMGLLSAVPAWIIMFNGPSSLFEWAYVDISFIIGGSLLGVGLWHNNENKREKKEEAQKFAKEGSRQTITLGPDRFRVIR